MKGPLTIKLSAKLFSGGEKCFGPGVASLLEGIDRKGSLRAAASEMGMAYSKAWTVLRQCEDALGLPLLERQVGGEKGGGSQITPDGRVLLGHYRRIEAQLTEMGQAMVLELNEGKKSLGIQKKAADR